jgi:D-glycero-beta-D-manno-heptose-7-phosphate kinase
MCDFSNVKIIVVGDIMLDEYLWGNVSRISPEAPVPIADVETLEMRLGGAANVAHNIVSLGGNALLCGVTGCDRGATYIILEMEKLNMSRDGLRADGARKTTSKTRVMGHNQQMIRIDLEDKTPIGIHMTKTLLNFIAYRIDLMIPDAIIISDYAKGVISQDLVQGIVKLCESKDILIGVDPKPINFNSYKGVDFITPSHTEAEQYCGFKIDSEENLKKAGMIILDNLECRMVLITQGDQGMTLFERSNDKITKIPTVAKNVFDVSGAGDTVMAVFALGLISGMTTVEAALLANKAAGVVVGKIGTSVIAKEELWPTAEEK